MIKTGLWMISAVGILVATTIILRLITTGHRPDTALPFLHLPELPQTMALEFLASHGSAKFCLLKSGTGQEPSAIFLATKP